MSSQRQNLNQSSPHPTSNRMGFLLALEYILPITLVDPDAPRNGKQIARWFVPIGLIIGLSYAAIFRGTWRLFGEVGGFRLMPGVSIWFCEIAFFGAAFYAAVGHWFTKTIANRKSEQDRTIGLILFLGMLIILKLSLWLAIPEGISRWPGLWGSTFNKLYPHAIYRPLILAPMWGRWGVLLASGLGKPTSDACMTTRALAIRRSSLAVLAWFVPLSALTCVYCGYEGHWFYGASLSMLVLAATYLFAVITANRLNGQNRYSALSAGFLAELVFLVTYIGFSVRIYAW